MTAASTFHCRQSDWCLLSPTLVVSLSAFSQYEFDLADLAVGKAAGRRERGQFLSSTEKLGNCG